MNECLKIRNFGPIREADLDIRDLTIFIGQQATGKSMAAQLLYFMRGIEDILPMAVNIERRKAPGDYDPTLESPTAQNVIAALEWWLGNHSSVYARPNTSLSWIPNTKQEEIFHEIQWVSEVKTPSDLFELIEPPQKRDIIRLNYYLETRFGENNHSETNQIYIPAGRALYSYLSASMAMPLLSRPKNRPDWPGYVFRFYQILDNTIRSLWEYQERRQKLIFENEMPPFLLDCIERILKGKVNYGPGSISLNTGGQTLRPDTIAAGQMESWPFFAILDDAFHNGEAEKLHIYFDEPEAHLHPGAQKIMMEIVAALVRNGTQVVLTTHSPYILYALNNSLAAGEVLGAGRPLPPDIPEDIALLPQQVAAYCFNGEGIVRDIMDREVGLIDSAELNRVAEDLGSDFTSMQEQLLNGGSEEDA